MWLISFVCLQIKCFFVWVDVLLQTLMNQLLDEHEEWLPILPQTTRVAAIASVEETQGGSRIDREVAFELRWMNQKIRELEDQSKIWNYICAFVGGIVIALGLMLTLYGKAWICDEFVSFKLYELVSLNLQAWNK